MIDQLSKFANALAFLRIPVVLLGLICLTAFIVIILGTKSDARELYLIPSAIGLLWSVSGYSFIITFASVPQKADPSWRFFRRMKRHLSRAGYGLLAVVFAALSAGMLFTSYRMIAIWLRDYAG